MNSIRLIVNFATILCTFGMVLMIYSLTTGCRTVSGWSLISIGGCAVAVSIVIFMLLAAFYIIGVLYYMIREKFNR